MALLPQPSLNEVGQAISATLHGWWTRESIRARRRLVFVVGLLLLLGSLGAAFITLPIFPDPPTLITSGEEACVYDSAPEHLPSRLGPAPTPQPVVAGRPGMLNFYVRNVGTCAWDNRVTVYREGGNYTSAAQVFGSIQTTSQGAFLPVSIPYTAPLSSGVYQAVYRMRSPDSRSFGKPIVISIITHLEGSPVTYPSEPPINAVTLLLLLLPGAIGFGIAVYHAGQFVKELYSLMNNRFGYGYVLRRLFALGPPRSATVSNGEVEVDGANETLTKIGGPGKLTVHGGMAALLERGGGFSRIVWAGKHTLAPFERARKAFDLRQLSRTKTESTWTKDGIKVEAEVTVSFKLMKRKDGEVVSKPAAKPTWWPLLRAWLGFKARKPKDPDSPAASPEAIRALVYESVAGKEWHETVSSGLDEEIPKRMLDELWAPDPDVGRVNPRREIVKELFDNAQKKQRDRGIDLIDIEIGPLVVPLEVADRRREWWRAFWEKDRRITEAEGNAEALQVRELARAEAQTRMIKAITQGLQGFQAVGRKRLGEVLALRFIDTVESIASVWLTDESRASYLTMINELRKLSSRPDGAEGE
ncbi:MAG TPA: NBR1-Ig-like domain-containing protein [Anaerolineae bacterium]|nr:NBR1-Ig-like domain-containing protein [Anaerolineae bacterium]